MSLMTLSTIAAQRDEGAPTKATAPNEDGDTTTRGYSDTLIASIPTEVLGLYTFVVGVIVANIEKPDELLGLRYGVFAGGLVAIVFYLVSTYRSKRVGEKRRGPWLELYAALVAFAAWGMVMPGSPLMADLAANRTEIWSAIITAAAIILLAPVGGKLSKQVPQQAAPRRRRARPA